MPTYSRSQYILGSGLAQGPIDMGSFLVTNIGAAGTDFLSGGGLSLAGALGVGVAAPSGQINTAGAPDVQNDARSNIIVQDSSANATGIGGGISFGKSAATAAFHMAGLKAAKLDAVAGNFGADLVFWTRNNGGTPAEMMRLPGDAVLATIDATIVRAGSSASLARFRLRGFYTATPSDPPADQCDIFVVDNGTAPVLRIRYNDASVMKTGDIALT